MVCLVYTQGKGEDVKQMVDTIICLSIQDDIAYVDAFGDTWMQFKGECVIDMGLGDVVWTSTFYSQLCWFVPFLQNFLTQSIVILTLLPIGIAKLSYCSRLCPAVSQSAINWTF